MSDDRSITPSSAEDRRGPAVLVELPAGADTDDLRRLLAGAMSQGTAQVVIDLSQDNKPVSSKIGALIRYKNRATRRGGDLRLLRPRGRMLEMLQITRLDTVFRIYEDEQQARNWAE